ncbi:hypothetical protein HXX76_015579 [Chlamydomonas incerta]|uniref:Uncharacterized protein n=1 Tax=Chlamydomonas incerta TaxID=51695 RepID=A0A835SGP7_CHLIN|nr:hypothetical protein HXX76_015579 [Chlamydomonas incerta]|eukprot:KAG2423063.1 hypothetical protein HXX76_015579 [Chlamydomonas incerta]
MEDCGRAVKYVIDSGAFDEIRKTVMEELKQSSSLRAAVLAEVEKSATLTSSTDKRPKETKQILDELNRELKSKLNDIASKTAWDILTTSSDSQASKDLERKVHEALNRMAEERELQQQQQKQSEAAPIGSTPAAGPARQSSLAAAEALGGAAAATTTAMATGFLPPARPQGAAPVTASLAPATQARDAQQQQQQQQAPQQQRPASRYGLVGSS